MRPFGLRVVGLEPPYSRLRLAKPVAPRVSPGVGGDVEGVAAAGPRTRRRRGSMAPPENVRAYCATAPLAQHLD